MTWSFHAAGHTPIPEATANDPQPWKEVEEQLRDDLAAVLGSPEYGTSDWQFAGNFVADQYPPLPPEPPRELTDQEKLDAALMRIAELEAQIGGGTA